jgi:hypothetical protein
MTQNFTHLGDYQPTIQKTKELAEGRDLRYSAIRLHSIYLAIAALPHRWAQ